MSYVSEEQRRRRPKMGPARDGDPPAGASHRHPIHSFFCNPLYFFRGYPDFPGSQHDSAGRASIFLLNANAGDPGSLPEGREGRARPAKSAIMSRSER